MLTVSGLCKRYGPVVALDDVGFEVERGEVVGFLGPNGAGKTTAMRAIMRLVSLDAGEVSWDGSPVTPALRQGFGYMPAERGMYQRMKVREHLVYYGRLAGLDRDTAGERVDRWLDRLGLGDRGDDMVQNLSSGNQQRVQLALALLNEPELLVLDEPFSGLDPIAAEMLSDVVREQVDRGAALLLSSHQLDLVADVCSAVVIVDRGRVVLRGDVAELRASSPTRYVDVEFASPTVWSPPVDLVAAGEPHPGPIGSDAAAPVDRVRVVVATASDADRLIAAARAAGEVVSYSFAPPGLSEVFMGAVGRDTVDDPDHDPDREHLAESARDGRRTGVDGVDGVDGGAGVDGVDGGDRRDGRVEAGVDGSGVGGVGGVDVDSAAGSSSRHAGDRSIGGGS